MSGELVEQGLTACASGDDEQRVAVGRRIRHNLRVPTQAAGARRSRGGGECAPDGYTLLVVSARARGSNPWLYKLSYDPIKAFARSGIHGERQPTVVVHPALPIHAGEELVRPPRAKPGDCILPRRHRTDSSILGGELFKTHRQGGSSACGRSRARAAPPMSGRGGRPPKVMSSSLVKTRLHPFRQAARAGEPAAPSAAPVLPTSRRSRKPAVPATRRRPN